MKWFKNISLIVLSLILSVAISVSVFAADGNVSYEGGAEDFVFSPGTSMSETSLFPNFENAMPGDTLTQNIQIVNNSSDSDYVKIYLRADPHDETSNPLATSVAETEDEVSMTEFLSQLKMTVKNGSETIFDTSPDQTGGLTENVLLGSFRKGEGTTLTVTLEVPITLGNEYANRRGEVDWIFTVEQFDTNPGITVDINVTSQPADPQGYVAGEEVTYSIKVTNNGDVDLKDVVVKDDLTGRTWTIGSLKVGQSITLGTSYTVTEANAASGTVVNNVTAQGKSVFDDRAVSAEDSVSVPAFEPTIPSPEPPAPTPTPTPTPSPGPVTPTPGPTIRPTPTPAPQETPSSSTTEIIDNPTPQAPQQEPIIDDPTPQGPPEKGRAWALVNLISAILTVLIAIGAIISFFRRKDDEEEDEDEQKKSNIYHANSNYSNEEDEDEDDRKRKKSKFLTLIPAIGSVIAFILTEDMRNPMIWVDKWTLLMIIILLANVLTAFFTRNKKNDEEEEDDEEA